MLLGCCHCGEESSSESSLSESTPPSSSESTPSVPSLSWDGHRECGYCRAVPADGFLIEVTDPRTDEVCLCALEGPWGLNGPFAGVYDPSTGNIFADGCSWFANAPMKAFYPDEEGGPLVCHDHPLHNSTTLLYPLWSLYTYAVAGYQLFVVLLQWYVSNIVGGGSFSAFDGTYHWARYTTPSLLAAGDPATVNCFVSGAFFFDTASELWPSTGELDVCYHMYTIGVSPI